VAGDAFHLYHHRRLHSQRAAAAGGRYSYVINGHMVAGYALIAWPARYGNTGVKTFIVNHYGQVYEKDMGPNTAQLAAQVREYNPDKSWSPVGD
jgi:hypothetical protein